VNGAVGPMQWESQVGPAEQLDAVFAKCHLTTQYYLARLGAKPARTMKMCAPATVKHFEKGATL